VNLFTCDMKSQGPFDLSGFRELADELIHLPDEPAGVYAPGGLVPPERKFNS